MYIIWWQSPPLASWLGVTLQTRCDSALWIVGQVGFTCAQGTSLLRACLIPTGFEPKSLDFYAFLSPLEHIWRPSSILGFGACFSEQIRFLLLWCLHSSAGRQRQIVNRKHWKLANDVTCERWVSWEKSESRGAEGTIGSVGACGDCDFKWAGDDEPHWKSDMRAKFWCLCEEHSEHRRQLVQEI